VRATDTGLLLQEQQQQQQKGKQIEKIYLDKVFYQKS